MVQLTTALLECLWGCEFYVTRGVLTTVSISETVPKHCDNCWILDCLCGGRMGQSPVVALGRFPSETTNVPKIRKRRKRSETMVIVTSKLIVSTLEHQRKRERTKESSSTIDEKPSTHKVSLWIFAGPPAETKGIYLLTYVE